jgi:hypothetical protein
MTVWEWESFDSVLAWPGFRVVSPGPLEAPILSFTLVRDDKRELILETLAVGKTSNQAVDHPPGTVRRTTETVGFKSDFGPSATAFGPTRCNRNVTHNAEGRAESREVWSVQRVEVTVREDGEPAFIIDWLENVSQGGIWMGEMIDTESSAPKSRTIGEGETAVVLKSGGPGPGSTSHAALELEIGGVRLFLCAELHMPERVQPGYIVYHGAPDAEVRKRIRNVLSFCLGNGLVYLGSTVLDAESHLLSTLAVSGNPFGDRIFGGHGPPAPLGTRFVHEVDQKMLSRMAAAIYDHYDELDFGTLSWAYWHAACAPVHIAAGHFGAAIEGMQAAYAKSHPKPARSKLIANKGKAQALIKAMTKALAGVALDKEALKRLENKITNLNSASGALVSERIMAELGLELGPDERAAWLRRNDAAHGKPPTEDDVVQLIRDTKLLRLILNRMVLRIAKASPTYIDDYSLGHANRALSQPVPASQV